MTMKLNHYDNESLVINFYWFNLVMDVSS